MRVGLILAAMLWSFIVWSLSGCGMLVKEMDLWGAKFKFPEGYSVNAGANTLDKVDDRKGLNSFKQ